MSCHFFLFLKCSNASGKQAPHLLSRAHDKKGGPDIRLNHQMVFLPYFAHISIATELLHQRTYSRSWKYLLKVNAFSCFATENLVVIYLTQKPFLLLSALTPISRFRSLSAVQRG